MKNLPEQNEETEIECMKYFCHFYADVLIEIVDFYYIFSTVPAAMCIRFITNFHVKNFGIIFQFLLLIKFCGTNP